MAALSTQVIEDKDVSELPGLNPENVHSIAAAMRRIGNPRKALYDIASCSCVAVLQTPEDRLQSELIPTRCVLGIS